MGKEKQEMRTCSIEGCLKKHLARGLCNAHYQKLLVYTKAPKRKTIEERFPDLYTPEPFSGCWLWIGCVNQEGYGQFTVRRKGLTPTSDKAHRLSFRLHKGEIPNGLKVLHSCDTPMCVNPAHLRLGTDRDNKMDSIRKGRHAHGETNGTTKLTARDVLTIRKLFADGPVNQTELGLRYGVHGSIINAVIHRRNWRHL